MLVPAGTVTSTLVADFFADEALGQRAGDVDLAGVVILFAGADERELFVVAEIEVLHDDRAAERHLVFRHLGRVHDRRPGPACR